MRIEPAEYEQMRSWLGYMVPKVFASDLLATGTDPVVMLDQMASRSLAEARRGLAMAIGDVVEFVGDWPAANVAKCDSELSQNGLPTLTQVQARFSKAVQRVVRRGRIRDDEEFYALRNAVEQKGVDAEILWRLLRAYETRGAGG